MNDDIEKMESGFEELEVDSSGEGERLDAYLARCLTDRYSRTRIKKMVEDGSIRIEGRRVAAHYHLKAGEKIQLQAPDTEEPATRAEDIPLDILHEDDDLIVVNKPAGMVVHPAHGNLEHTMVNALLFHTRQLSGTGGPVRPGIVHRLDKDTSGVLVVAKNERAHGILARQFKNHSIERTYMTIVRGVVQHNEGVVEEPVGRAFLNRKKVIIKPSGGKDATTYFSVLQRFPKADASLLKIQPQTGRTHQIRVHMAHIGHPVFGDSLYGIASPWINRQALHAAGLGFTHPTSGKRLAFESALPEDMQYLLRQLESQG